jgi:hypothetical protein
MSRFLIAELNSFSEPAALRFVDSADFALGDVPDPVPLVTSFYERQVNWRFIHYNGPLLRSSCQLTTRDRATHLVYREAASGDLMFLGAVSCGPVILPDPGEDDFDFCEL